MKKYPNIISSIGIKKFEENFLGIVSDMNIFFASDDKFSQHLCVAMASILKNALPIDFHNFYILDGGISNKNKRKIEKVKEIKDCKIEYIKINDSIFNNCKITKECQHISKQTYYRYLIAELKPELKRAFYFDCDIVVNDTLNNFWNINLENKYVAAVEELWIDANNYYKSILFSKFKFKIKNSYSIFAYFHRINKICVKGALNIFIGYRNSRYK